MKIVFRTFVISFVVVALLGATIGADKCGLPAGVSFSSAGRNSNIPGLAADCDALDDGPPASDDAKTHIRQICTASGACNGFDARSGEENATLGTEMACVMACQMVACPNVWSNCRGPSMACGQCDDLQHEWFWVNFIKTRLACTDPNEPLRPEVNQCMVDNVALWCPALASVEWWHTPHPYKDLAELDQWVLNWPKID